MLLLVYVVLVISAAENYGVANKQENGIEEPRSIVRAETPTEDNIYLPKVKAELEVGGHPVDSSPWPAVERDAPDLDLRLNSALSSENKTKRNRTTQRKKFTLKQDQIADQSNRTSQGKLIKKKKQSKEKKPSTLYDTSILPQSSTQPPKVFILTEDPVGVLHDQPQPPETEAQYAEELRRRQEIRRRHEQERQQILELRRQLEEERRLLEEERRRDEYERRRLHDAGRDRPRVPSPTDSQAAQQNILSSPSRGSGQSREQIVGGRPHSQTHTSGTGLDRHQGLPQSSSGAQQPSASVFSRYTRQPLDSAVEGSHVIPNQRPPSSAGLDPLKRQTDQQLPLTSYRGYSNSASLTQYDGQGQWYYPQRGAQESYHHLSYQDTVAFTTCPDTGIDLRINGLGCQQAVAQQGASLCYLYEYRSRECCQVCLARKVPARTGCEYGDHSQQCSSISAADCYEVRNRQVCCDTCERLRRRDAAVGCEYGDMSPRCDVIRQNPGLCYRPDNQRICCQSCAATRNTTNPGCPWGDYDTQGCQIFEGQTANVRLNCYLPQRRRFCCQACERLREWLPGNLPEDCQFGDRPVVFSTSHFGTLNCSNIFNYFRTDECRSNPAVYLNCCYTCHRYLTGQG